MSMPKQVQKDLNTRYCSLDRPGGKPGRQSAEPNSLDCLDRFSRIPDPPMLKVCRVAGTEGLL
jgi:hypothetical protein